MLRIFLAALILGCATNARAFFYDGNKLVADLRQFEKAERSDPATEYQASASYVGFVLGVHDTISSSLCSSGNLSTRQVTTVVGKHLNEHPADWGKPAHQLVAKALRDAFPCRKK